MKSKLALLMTVLISSQLLHSAHASTWEETLPEITRTQAQLILMGDSHSSAFHKVALNELFGALNHKDPSWNCILSESDPSWYQRAMDDTLNGTEPYATFPKRVFESAPAFIQSSYGPGYFDERVPASLPEFLFTSLRDAGARMIAIDLPKTKAYIEFNEHFPNLWSVIQPTPTEWDQRNRMQMIDRNSHLVNRIRAVFESGECKKAIAFLGTDHITQFGKLNLTDEKVITVSNQLESQFKLETVALFFDQDEMDTYEKNKGPSPMRGGLGQVLMREITYTPTITRW